MKTNPTVPVWGKLQPDCRELELNKKIEIPILPLSAEQYKFLKNRSLGLYRNSRLSQANSLRKAGHFSALLDTYLRVVWLDCNGPSNSHGLEAVFQKRQIFKAPSLMLEIARGAITFGLDVESLGKRFAECASLEIAAIAPLSGIVSIGEAWSMIVNEIAALIANGGKPFPMHGPEKIPSARYSRDRTESRNVQRTDPRYAENQFILKWWSKEHDELITKEILQKQWTWAFSITKEVVAITPPEVISRWKSEDPICSTYTGASPSGARFNLRYAWYNVLMNFAIARAHKLGLISIIKNPERRQCPLCGNTFVEDSLPYFLVNRLGINQLDFCAPCLIDTVMYTGSEDISKDQIISYLRDLADALQRIPSQDFGGGMHDLKTLSTDERLAVLRVLRRKPTPHCVQKTFGSWFNALIEAELIETGAQRMKRGTKCLANDGHMCFSLGEKTIDDLLYGMGVFHEREPAYPGSNYRADFVANGVFIEYFGLAGNAEYDAKSSEKRRLSRLHGIKLISILPEDLVSIAKLESLISYSLGITKKRAQKTLGGSTGAV